MYQEGYYEDTHTNPSQKRRLYWHQPCGKTGKASARTAGIQMGAASCPPCAQLLANVLGKVQGGPETWDPATFVGTRVAPGS